MGGKNQGPVRQKEPSTPAPRKDSSEPPGRVSGFRRRHESSKPPLIGGDEDKRRSTPPIVDGNDGYPDSLEIETSSFLLQLLTERDERVAELTRERGGRDKLPPTQFDGTTSIDAKREEQKAMERFELMKLEALIFESALVLEQTLDEGESREWHNKIALFLYLDNTLRELFAKVCELSMKRSLSFFHDVRNIAHRFMIEDIFERSFEDAKKRFENRIAGRLSACLQIINRQAKDAKKNEMILPSFEEFREDEDAWKPEMKRISFDSLEEASDELVSEQERAIEEFGRLREALHKELADSLGKEFEAEKRTQWIKRGTIFIYLVELAEQMHEMAKEMNSIGSFCVSQHIRGMVQKLINDKYFERAYQDFEHAKSKRRGGEVVDGIQTDYEKMHETIQQCVEYFGLYEFSMGGVDDIASMYEGKMMDALTLAATEDIGQIQHATPQPKDKE